jgi:voltage-gated potassium channel
MTEQRLSEIIEHSKKHDTVGAVFDAFIVTLICLNAIAVIAESFDTVALRFAFALKLFEYFSVFIFTIEYILRLWTAPYKFSDAKNPYIKYIFSFLAIIDFLSIAPFCLTLFIGINDGSVRILRLFRLLRILKITRYNSSLNIIGKVMKNEKDKISMTVFIIGIMILMASSIMYSIESEYQPEHFSNILVTMWWAVGTFTGNADVFPITGAGKILSGVIGILSIGLIALPSGIISSGFMKEIEVEKRGKQICPHCGKEIE